MAMATDLEVGYKIGKNPTRSPIAQSTSKIMDVKPSHSLATGLKRIGGRRGISRLGVAARKGHPIISHSY